MLLLFPFSCPCVPIWCRSCYRNWRQLYPLVLRFPFPAIFFSGYKQFHCCNRQSLCSIFACGRYLPVARVMWQAVPDLETGLECWITAGGAHHTVLSYDVSAEQVKDWATIMGIEFVHITKDTTVESLEKELFLNDIAWKLR